MKIALFPSRLYGDSFVSELNLDDKSIFSMVEMFSTLEDCLEYTVNIMNEHNSMCSSYLNVPCVLYRVEDLFINKSSASSLFPFVLSCKSKNDNLVTLGYIRFMNGSRDKDLMTVFYNEERRKKLRVIKKFAERRTLNYDES
jgi:hypothetical protein